MELVASLVGAPLLTSIALLVARILRVVRLVDAVRMAAVCGGVDLDACSVRMKLRIDTAPEETFRFGIVATLQCHTELVETQPLQRVLREGPLDLVAVTEEVGRSQADTLPIPHCG